MPVVDMNFEDYLKKVPSSYPTKCEMITKGSSGRSNKAVYRRDDAVCVLTNRIHVFLLNSGIVTFILLPYKLNTYWYPC